MVQNGDVLKLVKMTWLQHMLLLAGDSSVDISKNLGH